MIGQIWTTEPHPAVLASKLLWVLVYTVRASVSFTASGFTCAQPDFPKSSLSPLHRAIPTLHLTDTSVVIVCDYHQIRVTLKRGYWQSSHRRPFSREVHDRCSPSFLFRVSLPGRLLPWMFQSAASDQVLAYPALYPRLPFIFLNSRHQLCRPVVALIASSNSPFHSTASSDISSSSNIPSCHEFLHQCYLPARFFRSLN